MDVFDPTRLLDTVSTVLIALISAIASVAAAFFAARAGGAAKAIDEKLKIRQVRIDENQLIINGGGKGIPVDNDELWRSYLDKRQHDRLDRKEACEEVIKNYDPATDPAVGKPIPP